MSSTLRALVIFAAVAAGQVAFFFGVRALWIDLRRNDWRGCLELPAPVDALCVSTYPRYASKRCVSNPGGSVCMAPTRRADWTSCARRDRSIPAETAVAACTRIIEARLEHRRHIAAAHYLRGNARTFLLRRPDPDADAIADYDRAIQLRPDFSDAFFERGRARLRSGQTDTALRDFDDALKHDPKRADLLIRRAEQFERLGQIDRAIADYTAALLLKPTDSATLWRRAWLFERQARWREALADYEAAVKQRQGIIELTGSCRTKIMLDRAREALLDCDRAVDISNSYSQVYVSRGLARFVLGDRAGAKADWTRATYTRVDDGVDFKGRYGLAMIREADGDTAGATADFTAVRAKLADDVMWNELEATMGRFRKR